jgi:hypothetical protein
MRATFDAEMAIQIAFEIFRECDGQHPRHKGFQVCQKNTPDSQSIDSCPVLFL